MERKTIDELKSICRENNYKGFSKFTKKKDLLEFIQSKQRSAPVSNAVLTPIQPPTSPISPIISQTLTPPLIPSSSNIMLPQTEKTLTEIQNEEYELALQKEKKKKKKEDYKAEIDKLYSEKLTNSELDKIRLVRLNRFG